MHLGLGGFHRGHQALVFDALLRRGDARWGTTSVNMRSTELADALAAQDGLHSVQVRGPEGSRWCVGGAIWCTAVAAREPDRVVEALAAPGVRWVTVTVTEKGHDRPLAELLQHGLEARRSRGLSGLTVASCDNQRGNGDQLRALCENGASASLCAWMAQHCRFPNSMVDRIVPAATPEVLAQAAAALGVHDAAAIATEVFWEWVIEDDLLDPSDADALRSVGVQVVDDVMPFEDAKLRLLNGSHTALASIGVVLGLEQVSDCMSHTALRVFIHDLMTLDVGPALQRPDWRAYRDALLERFANPSIRHRLHQIALDGSRKIPQRWVAAVQDARAANRLPQRHAFAAAAWLRYLRGEDDNGTRYALDDPSADALQRLAREHAGNAVACVGAIGRLPAIWGPELVQDSEWLTCMAHWLGRMNSVGIARALLEINALTPESGSTAR